MGPLFRAVAVLPFLLLVLSAADAGAATYAVDMPNDLASADGCLLFVSDDCSLRGAVLKANAHAGTDTIDLAVEDYALTRVGAGEDQALTGDLDLLDDVVLVGHGAGITRVFQMAGDRVFDVGSGVVATFRRLTISNGNITGGDGGGIRNRGTIALLQQSAVVANQASGAGGGIYSWSSSLWLQQSSVEENHAGGAGGGVHLTGAGSVLTIEESAVVGNTSGSYGGGIGMTNTNGVIRNSTLSGNRSLSASSPTDGAYVNASTLVFESCTLADAVAPLLYLFNSTVTLRSTLLAGACAPLAGTSSILPDRGNLESPGDTCNLDDYTDLRNVDEPQISALGRYGGLAPSHRPAATSPAVDYLYATQRCQPDDQRGIARPQRVTAVYPAQCDVGAVELVADEIFLEGFEGGTWTGWSAAAVS